jgi:hypothetical protein
LSNKILCKYLGDFSAPAAAAPGKYPVGKALLFLEILRSAVSGYHHCDIHNDHIKMRRTVTVLLLVVLVNLQGCASTLDTFMAGAAVGIGAAVATVTCTLGCH